MVTNIEESRYSREKSPIVQKPGFRSELVERALRGQPRPAQGQLSQPTSIDQLLDEIEASLQAPATPEEKREKVLSLVIMALMYGGGAALAALTVLSRGS